MLRLKLYKLRHLTYFYELLKANNLLKSENIEKLGKNAFQYQFIHINLIKSVKKFVLL